ncbi:MAG: glycosyltransferase [Sandaracinaceae bacterium]|nr:glycosyltransferase [Sandaracinaceae bacterium]
MRILYGVTGHGMGHAMRAIVLARHLEREGHRVKLVTSGAAVDLLGERFGDVTRIDGLALRYVRGGVARTRSLLRTLGRAPSALARNVDRYVNEVSTFAPDVCVADFESFAHLTGLARGIPVISFDHQHVLTRCQLGPVERDVAVARALVSAKMFRCAHYVVTSFYRPPVKLRHAGSTTLVGPILRDEVLAREPRDGDHVLVYQTSSGHRRLLSSLGELRGHRFIVYGSGREGTEGHVTHRAFHPSRFLDDLASARAVVTHGGHTAISEALYFGKPVVSVPLRGQGEQLLNADRLDRGGWGRRLDRPTARSLRRALAWAEQRGPMPRVEAGNAELRDRMDRLLTGWERSAA